MKTLENYESVKKIWQIPLGYNLLGFFYEQGCAEWNLDRHPLLGVIAVS